MTQRKVIMDGASNADDSLQEPASSPLSQTDGTPEVSGEKEAPSVFPHVLQNAQLVAFAMEALTRIKEAAHEWSAGYPLQGEYSHADHKAALHIYGLCEDYDKSVPSGNVAGAHTGAPSPNPSPSSSSKAADEEIADDSQFSSKMKEACEKRAEELGIPAENLLDQLALQLMAEHGIPERIVMAAKREAETFTKSKAADLGKPERWTVEMLRRILSTDNSHDQALAEIAALHNASLGKPEAEKASEVKEAVADDIKFSTQKALSGLRDDLIAEAVACTTLLRDAKLNGKHLIAHESEIRRAAWLQASDKVLEHLYEHGISYIAPGASLETDPASHPNVAGVEKAEDSGYEAPVRM